MRKQFIRIGSFMAMLAVILGAFGAHTLKEKINPEFFAVFETGVRYQLYHAFAILIVGVLLHLRKVSYLVVAGWLFLIGIIFFSGSLYLLAFQEFVNEFPFGLVGPFTPIGGLFFIAGWIFLFLSSYQTSERNNGHSSS